MRNHSEKALKEEEKVERRREFNNKIRNLPVSINEQKRMKLLIEKDKSKNILKYQLLNRKGLSDYEIYEHSNRLVLPKNSKEIGNKYLEELREKNKGKNMELANSRSVDILWSPEKKEDKFESLEQIKSSKEKKHILYNNDLDVLLYYKAKKRQMLSGDKKVRPN